MQGIFSRGSAAALLFALAFLVPMAAFAQHDATGAQATQTAPEAYLTIEELRETFARLAVAYYPELLTDDRALDWFQDEHGSLYLGWGRDELGERYSRANTIERQAMLAQYKQEVLAEAQHLRVRLEAEGLRLRISERVKFTDFQPGTGLAFERVQQHGRRDSVFGNRLFRHSTHMRGTDFVGTLYDIAVPGAIPLASEEEAIAFLENLRASSRLGQADLVVNLSIRTFGTDHNLSGIAVADENDVPVTAVVDAITLDTVPDSTDRTLRGDTLVAFATTETAPARDTPPPDAATAALAAGLPVIDGHIVLPAGYTYIRSLLGISRYDDNLVRFLGTVALAENPEIARGQIENRDLRALLNDQQQLRLYGQRAGTSFPDEFARRRAEALFEVEILPELLAATPRLPLPVVALREVHLGPYDFASSSFPIALPGEPTLANLPRNFGALAIEQRFVALPDRLDMQEAEAERLLRRDGGGRPSLLHATFGLLHRAQDGTLQIEVTDIGLFEDAGLTRRLTTIDIAGALEEPVAVPAHPAGGETDDVPASKTKGMSAPG